MMDDKRTSSVWIVAALMLVLPVLYVGSYAALVRPDATLEMMGVEDVMMVQESYRYGGSYSETIFWPFGLGRGTVLRGLMPLTERDETYEIHFCEHEAERACPS